jgi:7-keto-8-aminopelargonate synthetase-like enzyme
MPPPIAAAAIAAIDVLHEEPSRVARLKSNTRMFLEKAKAAGFNTGCAKGFSIVPIVTGSEITAARLSHVLLRRGINVQPLFYPAVSKNQARLRFFLTSEHRSEQIDVAIATLAEESPRVLAQKVDYSALVLKLCSAE